MTVATVGAESKLATRARRALVSCFRLIDLSMLVKDHFDVKLDWVVNEQMPYEAVVFNLIDWAERNDQFLRLLTAAAQRNKRPELAALRDECAAAGTAGNGDPAAVRDAVVRFSERFRERRQRLEVLRENKALHDILHQLKERRTELDRQLATAELPGYDPFAAEVLVDELRKWVQMADACVPPPPTTDRRRRWVAKFADAVRAITARLDGGPPAAELPRSLEWLAHLPADQQPDLNERLLDAVSQLDVVSLGEPLDRLRTVLAPADARELLEEFVAFQGACGHMKRLIDQHRLCQLTDAALREADNRPEPATNDLSQWVEITEWLAQLSSGRPDDQVAARPQQAATLFAAAPQGQSASLFAALRQRFDRLFFNIDNELLRATGRVVESATVLNAFLSRYAR